MFTKRYTVPLTTAADGSATAYSDDVGAGGAVLQIRYTKTDFADGSTITITGETSGIAIWAETGVNSTATRAPRQASHTTAGVAALYAGAGVAVLVPVFVCNERIKIVVASGGDTKTGAIGIWVG